MSRLRGQCYNMLQPLLVWAVLRDVGVDAVNRLKTYRFKTADSDAWAILGGQTGKTSALQDFADRRC